MVTVKQVAELLAHKDLDIPAEYRIKPIEHFQEFPENWEFETIDDVPYRIIVFLHTFWGGFSSKPFINGLIYAIPNQAPYTYNSRAYKNFLGYKYLE